MRKTEAVKIKEGDELWCRAYRKKMVVRGIITEENTTYNDPKIPYPLFRTDHGDMTYLHFTRLQ